MTVRRFPFVPAAARVAPFTAALLAAIAAAACAPAPDESTAPDAGTAADAAALGSPVTTASPADTAASTPPAATSPADATATGTTATATATATATLPPELASFECAGAAPSDWSLALSAAGATLRLDGREHVLGGDLRQTGTGAWTWLGVPDATPAASYALLLVPSACFPGEGKPAQAYIAELSLPDGRRASGCCRPATPD